MSVTLTEYPYGEGRFQNVKETAPAYIPSAAETLFSANCWLQNVTLTNVSSSTVTVTLSDKQTSAKPVIYAAPLAANETLSIPFGDRFCPDGLTWVASAAGCIVGYVRAKL